LAISWKHTLNKLWFPAENSVPDHEKLKKKSILKYMDCLWAAASWPCWWIQLFMFKKWKRMITRASASMRWATATYSASRPSLLIIKLKPTTSGNSWLMLCVCEVRCSTFLVSWRQLCWLAAGPVLLYLWPKLMFSHRWKRIVAMLQQESCLGTISSSVLNLSCLRSFVSHSLEASFICIHQMHDGSSSSCRSRFGDEALYLLL